MQIWDFSPCWHRDCPDDTLKCITYSYNGKYLTYLEELGNENHLIQKYHEAYHFLGDISPTMVASILLDYKNYDIRDIRIRLVIAIHYLTLNDQFERRESK